MGRRPKTPQERDRRADMRHYDVPVPDPLPGDGQDFGAKHKLTPEQNDRILAALARAHPDRAPPGLGERLIAAGLLPKGWPAEPMSRFAKSEKRAKPKGKRP